MKKIVTTSTQATILWVEDDQDLRETLTDELTDAGYNVIQAANGQDALHQLKDYRPDLILCDIVMPVMDGYTLLRLIQETMSDLSDIPFVFLSAQDGSEQIIQGKHAGADDYLVKPINVDLMLATIAARLRQVQRLRHKFARDLSCAAEPLSSAYQVDEQPFHRLSLLFNLITAGIVLLERDGKIQFANMSAQRLLFDCVDPITRDIFSVDNLLGVNRLMSVIRAAIEANLNRQDYIEFLSFPRPNEQRNLLVTVCALKSSVESGDDASVVALFISAGGNNEPVPTKALNSLFKLTPTEGRIAWAFVQGMRADKIAKTFNISLTTVAFHKRNIFQKTNTNRQADLIALLLTLPACTNQTRY